MSGWDARTRACAFCGNWTVATVPPTRPVMGLLLGRGVDEAVRTGEHLAAQHGIAEPGARGLERRLVDGARGQAQVVGAVVVGGSRRRGGRATCDAAERVAQQPVQRPGVGRLDERDARQLEAHRRGDRALVGAASGARVTPLGVPATTNRAPEYTE